jgi:hypothetical protein
MYPLSFWVKLRYIYLSGEGASYDVDAWKILPASQSTEDRAASGHMQRV